MARSALHAALFLLIAWAACPEAAAAQPYTVLEIRLPPGFEVHPTGINNQNQVVGNVTRRVSWDRTMLVDGFLWDPVNGLRFLGIGAYGTVSKVDDAGVIYGTRLNVPAYTSTAFKWINGVFHDVPVPPHDDGVSIHKVTSNGIVQMRARLAGHFKMWALREGVLIDLDALAGAHVETLNEQMALAGCQDRLSSHSDAIVPQIEPHPYVRFADGRVIQPWDSPSCVHVLGPSGHFVGVRIRQRYVDLRLVTEYYAYYGYPDGRVITVPTPRDVWRMVDINRSGTLLGYQLWSGLFPFIAREGSFIDLRQAILPSSRALGSFLPLGINDAGVVLGIEGGTVGVVLVPTAPVAPARLTFSVSGRSVTLNWDPSFGALEYVLEVGSAPGTANLYVGSVGAASSLSTVAPPGRYYVRVRARNARGLSGPSNEVIIDVS